MKKKRRIGRGRRGNGKNVMEIDDEMERLNKLIYEYGSVFAEHEQDLGCATGV